MRKCRIVVNDYSDATHGSSATHYDKNNPPEIIQYNVDAWCVGGDVGVRSYFIIDNSLYEAHGDDGHWWLVSKLASRFLAEIIEALRALSKEEIR